MKTYQNAVFITGAGQRIGYYLAKSFLKKTDYPVVFTYRTHRPQVDELVALGALGFQVDFTLPNALPTLVKQVKEQVVSLRAVIHNASLWLPDERSVIEGGGQDELSLLKKGCPGAENFEALFQLHAKVPYDLNGAFTPLLRASLSPLKDIISLSDAGVFNGFSADYIAYGASKAALQALMRGFAKRLAPDIKVNDIAPALIMFNEGDDELYKQRRLAQSALGVEPGAEVVWQAVQYLMNSPYSTGSVLALDGGVK